jgi:hypothetical protein
MTGMPLGADSPARWWLSIVVPLFFGWIVSDTITTHLQCAEDVQCVRNSVVYSPPVGILLATPEIHLCGDSRALRHVMAAPYQRSP